MAKYVLLDTDVMVDFLTKHYPMIKGLKRAYTKTSGGQPSGSWPRVTARLRHRLSV